MPLKKALQKSAVGVIIVDTFVKIRKEGTTMIKETKHAKYSMVKKGDSYTFFIKEESNYSAVKIEHISDLGANMFFNEIISFDVRACQLLSVAEDKAAESVTEIFKELL